MESVCIKAFLFLNSLLIPYPVSILTILNNKKHQYE